MVDGRLLIVDFKGQPHSSRKAPSPHCFSIVATRPTSCSTAASIVSRRAVGHSADQRAANRGATEHAGTGSSNRPNA